MVSRKQIKHAIEVLEQATDEEFVEVKNELAASLKNARSLIQESEKKILALTLDRGKSEHVFGFTEKYVAQIDVKHSHAVSQFVTNWCQRQSDWRYPWCWLIANRYDYVHLSVKSHLVYVCCNHVDTETLNTYTKTKIGKTERASPQMFRVKPLEFTGHISNFDVPYDQIGSLICLDLIPYLSIEQIDKLIESCSQVLRPGGQALLHFSDTDNKKEWEKLIEHKITYCSEQLIQDLTNQHALKCDFYHIDDMYSFAVLTKDGEKTSIKAHFTGMQPTVKRKKKR